MTARDEVHAAFRPRKARKNLIVPRAQEHGYLGSARDLPERKKPATKGHDAVVERGLSVIAQEQPEAMRPASETYQAAVVGGAQAGLDPVDRARYAALETRKELAAVILGAGGTLEEAGANAGVAASTVSNYLVDPDFRARVEELRSIVRNKVAGRIEAWMDRYTADSGKLDEKDPKNVLAVYDRIAGSVRSIHAEQTTVTVNNGPGAEFMGRLAGITRRAEASLPVDDAPAESGGFPIVGADSPRVAG